MKQKGAQFINPQGLSVPKGLLAALHGTGGVAEMRAAAPLPKDAQEMIDSAVVRVGRDRLIIVDDMISEGLTLSLPNWLAVPSIYWERMGEAGHAQRTMVPKSRGERQIIDRAGTTIPIYCTWDDFSFTVRELAAAARGGAPLDASGIEQATRNVNEAIEDAALNGAGVVVDGNDTPGLLSSTNTQTYVSNESWAAAGHSGQDILQDVLNMMDVARADNFFGPYNLYVPTTYDAKLNQNFSDGVTTFDSTIRERLERITAGGRPLRIRAADKLPTTTTLLMQMTSDVADVIVGQTPAVVSWSDGPGWETYFVVLSCVVPRLKVNYDGNYGVVVGTPS